MSYKCCHFTFHCLKGMLWCFETCSFDKKVVHVDKMVCMVMSVSMNIQRNGVIFNRPMVDLIGSNVCTLTYVVVYLLIT